MKLSIHQPNFVPWIPTLAKIAISDSYIILDHVKYSKNGWTNRCGFSLKNKKKYITVPVKKSDLSLQINRVRHTNTEHLLKKNLKTIK